MAQTEELMLQNVAYRPTVYKAGSISCSKSTKSGLKTCLKTLLKCFAFDALCSKKFVF